MASKDELMIILNNIQDGKISPEDGLALMNILRELDPIEPAETGKAQADQVIAQATDQNAAPSTDPSEGASPPAMPEVPPAPAEVISPANSAAPGLTSNAQNGNDHSTLQPVDIAAQPGAGAQPDSPQTERISGETIGEKDAEREIQYWKNWWQWPFWIGTALTFIGALIMYLGYEAAHFGFFFWFAWLPFFLGVVIVAISWQSRMVHWLHVRVHQKPGEKPGTISISLPLPIGLMSWFLNNFGHLIPGLRNQKINGNDIGEILSELGKNVSPDNPFYVHVNGNDGEEVEVFIG
jgi:hypothetical protein